MKEIDMRKIILLICMAFFFVCYAFPCFVIPFGEYKGEIDGKEVVLKFNWKGEVKDKDGEFLYYYKMEKNKVVLSDDKTFDDNDTKITLNSIYSFQKTTVDFASISVERISYTNNIGMYSAIGVGILMVLLIITIPKRQ